ncbi:Mitochondrial intermediate peptidase [Orobanche minor]
MKRSRVVHEASGGKPKPTNGRVQSRARVESSQYQQVLEELILTCFHRQENSMTGELGYLYLDLESRKEKHPMCTHFAIKRMHRISDTEYQLPLWTAALVCNFSGPSSQYVMHNHSDVETLFHEFGHALHSMLSIMYQQFSGTKVVLDFAEKPSSLFE